MKTSQDTTDIGMNRTGAAASPIDSKDIVRFAAEGSPSSDGNEHDAMTVRALYERESGPVGTMPPPATLKGAVSTLVKKAAGKQETVLLDKLGERLAFERSGARLYEAMMGKVEAWHGADAVDAMPPLDALRRIHADEVLHFRLVWEAIEKMGGDPTAVTPCADAVGVRSMGLLQNMLDPRTDLAAATETLLAAELIDRDGWETLIDLAQDMGQAEMAETFRTALADEERHLDEVRLWAATMVREKAGLGEGPSD